MVPTNCGPEKSTAGQTAYTRSKLTSGVALIFLDLLVLLILLLFAIAVAFFVMGVSIMGAAMRIVVALGDVVRVPKEATVIWVALARWGSIRSLGNG